MAKFQRDDCAATGDAALTAPWQEVGTKMRQSMVRMKTKMMDRRAKGAKQAVHADEMAAELLEDLAEFAQVRGWLGTELGSNFVSHCSVLSFMYVLDKVPPAHPTSGRVGVA